MSSSFMRMGHAILFCIMIVAIVLIALTAHAGATVSRDEAAGKHESVFEDFQWLRHMIDDLSHDEVRLVAANYGVLAERTEAPEALLHQLLSTLPGESEWLQDGDSWTAAKRLTEHTILNVSLRLDGAYVVIVMQLQSTKLESNDSYASWFAELDRTWETLGLSSSWRVNLQSKLNADMAPGDVWDVLIRSGAIAELAGDYDDGGSMSRTYNVPFMYGLVTTDAYSTHLQAAVHQLSEDLSYRVTLGSPLITIEY